MTVRLVLADDHAPFRGCLRSLLDRQPGLSVVGEFARGHALVDALQNTRTREPFDVLLLDLSLRDSGGLDIARRLIGQRPALRILVLSWHDDLPLVRAACALGCCGYVLKDDPLDEVVYAIREIASGRAYVSSALSLALGITAGQSPQFAD